jgi:hypothetical protein
MFVSLFPGDAHCRWNWNKLKTNPQLEDVTCYTWRKGLNSICLDKTSYNMFRKLKQIFGTDTINFHCLWSFVWKLQFSNFVWLPEGIRLLTRQGGEGLYECLMSLSGLKTAVSWTVSVPRLTKPFQTKKTGLNINGI